MCNTPLRLYKQYAHHGGTLTPMIAHWPKGIQARGALCKFPSHLVDIMATVVDVAETEYPKTHDGNSIQAMEGVTLLPVLQGSQNLQRTQPIFWEFSGNHAVRSGDWKLVAEKSKDWELYNVAVDRSETTDLAKQKPEMVKQLGQVYDQWANRVEAKTHNQSMKSKPSKQSQLFDLDSLVTPN